MQQKVSRVFNDDEIIILCEKEKDYKLRIKFKSEKYTHTPKTLV